VRRDSHGPFASHSSARETSGPSRADTAHQRPTVSRLTGGVGCSLLSPRPARMPQSLRDLIIRTGVRGQHRPRRSAWRPTPSAVRVHGDGPTTAYPTRSRTTGASWRRGINVVGSSRPSSSSTRGRPWPPMRLVTPIEDAAKAGNASLFVKRHRPRASPTTLLPLALGGHLPEHRADSAAWRSSTTPPYDSRRNRDVRCDGLRQATRRAFRCCFGNRGVLKPGVGGRWSASSRRALASNSTK